MEFKSDDQSSESQPITVEHIVPDEDELKIVPQKSYKCEICGYCVRTKANLWVHRVKTHRIVKTDSDVAFLYRTKRHVKKIFHCPVRGCKYQAADRGFPKYSALRQHYIWVHGGRDHLCSICFRLFPSATHLERHRLSCGQFHICPTCNRRYSELKYLKQHIKRAKHEVDNRVSNTAQVHSDSINDMSGVIKITSKPVITSNQTSDFNQINAGAQSSIVTSVQTLQPIILPVVIPLTVPSDLSKGHPSFEVETSGIADAIASALRPVIERMSNEAATQTSPQIPQQASSMVQVAMAPSPSNQMHGKKIDASVPSQTYMNIGTGLEQTTVGLGTDINPLLQPVGSQTEDLFGNPYDRTCLHVETQTCGPVENLLMTQTSPQLPPQTSTMVQVPIAPSSAGSLEEKKITANVASEAFLTIPTSLSQSTVALGTGIHPLLQPVGSQTEDLFGTPYDRNCLHVETQTCGSVVDVFSGAPSRNLQTPQPPMVSTQTLVSSNAAAEFLSNMETQTDPIDAWIEAELKLSDIETQTSAYDLDSYLAVACSQTQTM